MTEPRSKWVLPLITIVEKPEVRSAVVHGKVRRAHARKGLEVNNNWNRKHQDG